MTSSCDIPKTKGGLDGLEPHPLAITGEVPVARAGLEGPTQRAEDDGVSGAESREKMAGQSS